MADIVPLPRAALPLALKPAYQRYRLDLDGPDVPPLSSPEVLFRADFWANFTDLTPGDLVEIRGRGLNFTLIADGPSEDGSGVVMLFLEGESPPATFADGGSLD
jgi:hypothetical protein